MLPILDLLRLIINNYLVALVGGAGMLHFPIMLGIVLSIVFRQHSRQARLEEHLFGASFSPPLRQTLLSLSYGMAAGLGASLVMVSLGLPLSMGTGIIYVWPVVLILMMIAPRFMCFAYGGGVVGVVALLIRALATVFPQIMTIGLLRGLAGVDLPSLMALIAILHLTESVLILVSGHLNASPIVIEGDDGRVTAGFMLQRFWPLPLLVLMVEVVQILPPGDSVAMPNWWPLLVPMIVVPPGMLLSYGLFPVVAALGYSDLAVANSPREKSRRSFRNLLLYSIVLLALALAAGKVPWLQLLPVLFAPLGHEYLIRLGNQMEWDKPARLAPPERGVLLLTTLPGSPAREAGLDTGWLILAANGIEVNNRRELAGALAQFPGLAELDMQSPAGKASQVRIHQRDGRMGLVAVPAADEKGSFLKIQQEGSLTRWFRRRRANNQPDDHNRGA